MKTSRKTFIQSAAAALAFPAIVPSRVLGAGSPSHMIHIAQIGCGRIARDMDARGFLGTKGAMLVGFADLDSKRLANMAAWAKEAYAKQKKGKVEFTLVKDFHDLISRADVDAVSISTPDHWHAQVAVEAAFAGKHVYMQKPASLTIREGRIFSNAVTENKRIFLLGSQQRSWKHFIDACEYVRSGRLGKITKIQIGLPGDPAGGRTEEMPVPENLDYDFWLGSTPQVYYTEDRVHYQNKDVSARPGWLRCEQFGAGMITGWGSHHLDIAHWAMDWEKIGPTTIEGKGVFPTKGLWDVHGPYDIHLTYPGGVDMHVWDKYPNGIRFIGEKGWIFVSRGATRATASDPVAPGTALKALDASDVKLISGEPEVKLYRHGLAHHQHFIECIKANKESVVPAETAHRSCTACLLSWIGMKLGRRLTWDYKTETFVNDPEADALLARTERAPYGAQRAYDRLAKQKKS